MVRDLTPTLLKLLIHCIADEQVDLDRLWTWTGSEVVGSDLVPLSLQRPRDYRSVVGVKGA